MFNDKKKIKFIMSFISCILFYTGGICCLKIGQFNVYITSYFHHANPNNNIDMQIGNLLSPVFVFCFSFFQPLGGFFEKKLGLTLTLIITSIFTEVILFIFINQSNIWLTLLLLIILGANIGIGTAIPGKSIYYYYPERNGIIGSFVDSSTILISILIGVLGEKMINPKGIILKPGERYFPLEISKNFILFYKYVLIIIPVSLIITLLLITDPATINETNKTQEKTELLGNKKASNISKNLEKKDLHYSENLKSAIFNRRLWKIASVFSLSGIILGFCGNTFRVYGALTHINSNVMQYLQVFTGFSSIFVGPLWGLINDKYGFSYLIKILCLGAIFQSFILGVFIKYNFAYIICVFIGPIIASGIQVIFRPHIMKVYGIRYLLEIKGIINICGGLTDIVGVGLSFFISKYYHTGEELQIAYKIVYLFGIVLCYLAFYLSQNENDNKFNYPYPIEEEKKIE